MSLVEQIENLPLIKKIEYYSLKGDDGMAKRLLFEALNNIQDNSLFPKKGQWEKLSGLAQKHDLLPLKELADSELAWQVVDKGKTDTYKDINSWVNALHSLPRFTRNKNDYKIKPFAKKLNAALNQILDFSDRFSKGPGGGFTIAHSLQLVEKISDIGEKNNVYFWYPHTPSLDKIAMRHMQEGNKSAYTHMKAILPHSEDDMISMAIRSSYHPISLQNIQNTFTLTKNHDLLLENNLKQLFLPDTNNDHTFTVDRNVDAYRLFPELLRKSIPEKSFNHLAQFHLSSYLSGYQKDVTGLMELNMLTDPQLITGAFDMALNGVHHLTDLYFVASFGEHSQEGLESAIKKFIEKDFVTYVSFEPEYNSFISKHTLQERTEFDDKYYEDWTEAQIDYLVHKDFLSFVENNFEKRELKSEVFDSIVHFLNTKVDGGKARAAINYAFENGYFQKEDAPALLETLFEKKRTERYIESADTFILTPDSKSYLPVIDNTPLAPLVDNSYARVNLPAYALHLSGSFDFDKTYFKKVRKNFNKASKNFGLSKKEIMQAKSVLFQQSFVNALNIVAFNDNYKNVEDLQFFKNTYHASTQWSEEEFSSFVDTTLFGLQNDDQVYLTQLVAVSKQLLPEKDISDLELAAQFIKPNYSLFS